MPNKEPPKNGQLRPRAAKTPQKMETNLNIKKTIFGGQVGLHVEGVLATLALPKINFLSTNLASCWPHASRQHEPMLDGQHGPMLETKVDPVGDPTDLQKLIILEAKLVFNK